jgi:hypothetical protein
MHTFCLLVRRLDEVSEDTEILKVLRMHRGKSLNCLGLSMTDHRNAYWLRNCGTIPILNWESCLKGTVNSLILSTNMRDKEGFGAGFAMSLKLSLLRYPRTTYFVVGNKRKCISSWIISKRIPMHYLSEQIRSWVARQNCRKIEPNSIVISRIGVRLY